ncbi:MAG: leucine--tRNA ligase, partial [Candidatus Paceibacteria bacterium]
MVGNRTLLQKEKWPIYNPKFLKARFVTYAIQVNGKLRHTLVVKAGTPRRDVEKLAKESQKVKKWLEQKRIKRIIFVYNKLINFVI